MVSGRLFWSTIPAIYLLCTKMLHCWNFNCVWKKHPFATMQLVYGRRRVPAPVGRSEVMSSGKKVFSRKQHEMFPTESKSENTFRKSTALNVFNHQKSHLLAVHNFWGLTVKHTHTHTHMTFASVFLQRFDILMRSDGCGSVLCLLQDLKPPMTPQERTQNAWKTPGLHRLGFRVWKAVRFGMRLWTASVQSTGSPCCLPGGAEETPKKKKKPHNNHILFQNAAVIGPTGGLSDSGRAGVPLVQSSGPSAGNRRGQVEIKQTPTQLSGGRVKLSNGNSRQRKKKSKKKAKKQAGGGKPWAPHSAPALAANWEQPGRPAEDGVRWCRGAADRCGERGGRRSPLSRWSNRWRRGRVEGPKDGAIRHSYPPASHTVSCDNSLLFGHFVFSRRRSDVVQKPVNPEFWKMSLHGASRAHAVGFSNAPRRCRRCLQRRLIAFCE